MQAKIAETDAAGSWTVEQWMTWYQEKVQASQSFQLSRKGLYKRFGVARGLAIWRAVHSSYPELAEDMVAEGGLDLGDAVEGDLETIMGPLVTNSLITQEEADELAALTVTTVERWQAMGLREPKHKHISKAIQEVVA
jgi:hypothetical protein